MQNFLVSSAVYGVATLELIVRSVHIVEESMLTEISGPPQSSEHPAWRKRMGLWTNHFSGLDFWESH